eukprot:351832_1
MSYLPFPASNNNDSPPKSPQKKNNKSVCNPTIQSTLKQKHKNGTLKSKSNKSKNTIKYDIKNNKSKTKLNKIIINKIPIVVKKKSNNPSTHNLMHNPFKNNNKKSIVNADEKWECSICTYKNLSIMAYCEICDAKKVINQTVINNNNDSKQQLIVQKNNIDEDGDLTLSMAIIDNDDDHKMDTQNQNQSQSNDYQFAKQLMIEESENVPNYNKRSYSEDEEIARKLQEQFNKSKELELKQKELEDAYLAKKIQHQLEEEERKLKRKKHKEDEAMAKRLQKEHEEELLKLEKQKLENERVALVLQAKEDMNTAKYYEEKQKEDEMRMRDDESFAFKMQQELNKGQAWFCNGCFAMNMDIKQYKCLLCNTIRPKPSIPKYILSMRDDLATHIIKTIRQVPGSIVNITFVQNFIVKYFTMCEEIGIKLSYPKIVYHWTKSSNFAPISKTGLKVPDGNIIQHQTDTGYYGRGIYTSPDPKYAQGYGHGANKLFVCLSLPGRQYKASYPQMLGKPLMDGYDSHISKDRNEMEWVFFNSHQLLLCYLVTLDFLEAKAKQQMDYVCQFLESKFLGMREEKLNTLTKDDV